ncbi:MAG: Zn-ribbon domain-containing OB-fold protein [Actinomycetota bacterium]
MEAPFEVRALTGAEFREGVIGVDHALRAEYAWDTGIAIGRYLAGLKEGKILARVCRGCERTLVPPRMFCEQCFRPTDAWAEVSDTGVVNTFSICHVSWDLQPLAVPEIPAVIELDGASPGIGILHKLGAVDPARVHIGMKVRAHWKPAGEREGSILDIRHWEPR